MLRAMVFGNSDLRLVECPIPEIEDGEVLVANCVSTTCGTDVKILRRGYPLLKTPHPFGHEFSGVITKVGRDVTKFSVGDRVAVHNSAPCGRCFYCKRGQFSLCVDQKFNRGAYAEYVVVPQRIVVQNMFMLSDSISHRDASLLEPLACAVYGVENCPIQVEDIVLVIGAGFIGLMMAMLAAGREARVIISDRNSERLRVAEKLGVWRTIQVHNADVRELLDHLDDLCEDRPAPDVVVEATGVIDVWNKAVELVRPGGFVLFFGGPKADTQLVIDAPRLLYKQIGVKGVVHTTPLCVTKAMSLINHGQVDSGLFVGNDYDLPGLENALIEHSNGVVIKNCITYR